MQIFLYLICALLLGLILGWFIWGRLSDRVRAMQSERDEALAKLRARGDGSQDRAKLDALTKDLDECRRMRHDQDDEIERLNRELSAARDPAGSMSAAPVAAAAAGLTVSTEEDKPSTLASRDGLLVMSGSRRPRFWRQAGRPSFPSARQAKTSRLTSGRR